MKDVQFLTSDLLTKAGVKHGWFMRYGGVSEGLFDSLNGKKGNGDIDENVVENRKRALAGVCHPELDSGSSCTKDSCLRRNDNKAHIIHEFKINILEATKAGEYEGFDASITTQSDVVLSQTTADCGTVIISDSIGSVVSLVHGSWHTLSAKIICDVVAKMKTHTSAELVAAIGPMICKSCYEFGPEAQQLFEAKYLTPKNAKFLIDLNQMIIDQLHESGVTQIGNVEVCTLEDERFFSHRRSGAQSGRFLTIASIT